MKRLNHLDRPHMSSYLAEKMFQPDIEMRSCPNQEPSQVGERSIRSLLEHRHLIVVLELGIGRRW